MALFWSSRVQLSLVNYSQHHILMWIKDSGDNFLWLLIGLYGELNTNRRQKIWNLLKVLRPRNQSPWLIVGDFNEVLFHHEKSGGKLRPKKQMQDFKDTLDFYNIHDLGYKGDRCTWSNKYETDTFTKERLDRAAVNMS